MGIFDRLGDVIKSYLNDEDAALFGKNPRDGRSRGDPDLDAAYDELNEFLGKGKEKTGPNRENGGYGRSDEPGSRRTGGGNNNGGGVPETLRQDFAELGLPLGASAGECKAAYKNLLKIHHPDRHAGHSGNMKKATEKSARINAAYDRIEKWRKTGTVA